MAKAITATKAEKKPVSSNNGEKFNITDIQNKFKLCYKKMNDSLIERSEEIKIVLTSLIAGEHPLLIGPPGTAKSLLIDSMMKWIDSGKKFSALMGKFTTPEELFGTVDLVKLTHERVYTRNTSGQLPEADLAFLDEIFLSSSAVLNTLLKVLNERTWRNTCGTEIRVPLLMCLAAGNQFPTAQELGALYDRFLFRKKVRAIETVSGRDNLLFSGSNHTVSFDPDEQITREEIVYAKKFVRSMQWHNVSKQALMEIWKQINTAGIRVGDRRMLKTKNAIQAFAFLNGHDEVQLKDLAISAHSLWEDPNEQPEKVYKIVSAICDPASGMANDFRIVLSQLQKSLTDPNTKTFEVYKKAEKLRGNIKKAIAESDDLELTEELKTILAEADTIANETSVKFQ